jgi:hypothetical protein
MQTGKPSMQRIVVLAILALVGALAAGAQQPNLEPNRPQQQPVPVVSFDVVWPSATPAHYAVAVESTGRAAYRADNPDTAAKGEPYVVKFTVSDATRHRIFELAQQARYFRGDFDYKKSRIADTGTKTLSYSEGPGEVYFAPTNGVRSQTTYNWSENHAIQQLTDIFQDLGATLEHGRKLSYLHRFDKLGLDAELKNMEEARKSGQLVEIQAIAPILRDIAQDYYVLRLARQRAERLLNGTHTASAQPSSH